MQSVLPNQFVLSQPTTYATFEADDQYRRAYQDPIPGAAPTNTQTTSNHLHRDVRCNVESHPEGSTVIQTETPTKHLGGLRGKIENLKLRAGEHMGIGTDTATRWSLYQLEEPLFGEFRANLVNGNLGFSAGFLFISSAHLCFSSFTNVNNRAVKVAIPMKNIVKIGLAQRLRNTAGTGVVLTPLSSLSMKANGLQVFTRDGVLHQFFGFKKKTESMFNTLTHVWQSSGASNGFQTNEATTSVNAYQQALLSSGFTKGVDGVSSSTYPVSHAYPTSTLTNQYVSQQPVGMTQPVVQNVEVRHVNPASTLYEIKQELPLSNNVANYVAPTQYKSM